MSSSEAKEKGTKLPITIHLKCGSDTKEDLLVGENIRTVLELKELIEPKVDVPATQQRLIFAGKLLKDQDEVSKYGLYEGCTIHVVRHGGAKPKSTTETAAPNAPQPTAPGATPTAASNQMPFPGMFPGAAPAMDSMYGNPNYAMDLMRNPEAMRQVSQMIESNPALFQAIAQHNPHLQSLPPEMRNLMANPDFMRTMLNPDVMASMMSMTGQNYPPGTNAPTQGGAQPTPFANPWSMAANAGYAQPQPAAASQEPPSVRFATQLEQLKQMGFYDEQQNIQALTVANGNVNAAVEWLLTR